MRDLDRSPQQGSVRIHVSQFLSQNRCLLAVTPLTASRRRELLEGVATTQEVSTAHFCSKTRNHFNEPWIIGRTDGERLDLCICWKSRLPRYSTDARSYYSTQIPLPPGRLPLLSDGRRVVKFERIPGQGGSGDGLKIIIGDLNLNPSRTTGICDPIEQVCVAAQPPRGVVAISTVLRAPIEDSLLLDEVKLPERPNLPEEDTELL